MEPAGLVSSHAVFRNDDTWVATGTEASDSSGVVTALFDLARGDRWPVWVQSGVATANKDAPLIVEGLPLVTISDLLAVPLTPTNAVVSWSVDSHGAAISNVVSYWSGANPINTVTGDFSEGMVIAIVTNLTANTTYDFFVLSDSGLDANTTAGAFAMLYSNVVSKAWVRITNVPTRGVVDTATRSTTLSWDIENNSGQSIHNTVAYSWTTGTDSGEGTASSDTAFGESVATVTIPNLIAGATYIVTASSSVVGHEGNAVYSSSIPNGTFGITAQELPTSIISIANVVTEFVSDTAALVTWSAVKTNATDWAYHYVAYSTNSVMTSTNILVAKGVECADASGQVMAILEGLTPEANYTYFVQSVIDSAPSHYATANNQGAGYAFTTDIPTTLTAIPLDTSLLIRITNAPTSLVTDRMALITWGVSNAFTFPGTHYVIVDSTSPTVEHYNTKHTVIASGIDDNQGTAAVFLDGLTPGSTYHYYIQSTAGLGNDYFCVTDNNVGLYYKFVTAASTSSNSAASGTGGSETGSGAFASEFDSGSTNGTTSAAGSGNGSESSSGSTSSTSSNETNSSENTGNSTVDSSAQTVKLTVSLGFGIYCVTDAQTGAGVKLTLSGPGMQPCTKELDAEFIDYSTTYTDEETGETITNPDWRAYLNDSVTWNADLIPGEKYTLKCEWKQKPSFVESIDCSVSAGVSLSSTNFLWPPSGVGKSFGMNRFYSEGVEITDSDGMDGTSNIWTITAPKVEIAVDANRDGEIKFDGTDATTKEKPFRFWINNDYDSNEGDATPFVDEVYNTMYLSDDWSSRVKSKRDLEDYFKIAVRLKGVDGPLAKEGGLYMQVYTEAAEVGDQEPVGYIYVPSQKDCSGVEYLKSELVAADQVSGTYDIGNGKCQYAESIGYCSKSPGVGCGYALWAGNDAGQNFNGSEIFDVMPHDGSTWYFLMDAVKAGKGKLCFRLYGFGSVGCTEASIFVDLKDIKQMYQRTGYVNSNNSIDHRADNPNVEITLDAWQPADSFTFAKPSDETEECIVFVHGWAMPDDYVQFYAETLYKRLWWQGYKGRVVAFRWPCQEEPFTGIPLNVTFNSSELRAWRSAGKLKETVNSLKQQLPGYRMSVIAHSQGGVISAEALRQGMQVDNYVLLAAALPAGCVDSNNNLWYELFRPNESTTPRVAPWGYEGYLSEILANVQNAVNFYNPNDFAIVSGLLESGFPSWEQNQIMFKPDGDITWSYTLLFSGRWWYSYKPYVRSGSYASCRLPIEYHRGLRSLFGDTGGSYLLDRAYNVKDREESLSFVSRPRTKAIGAVALGTSVSGFEMIPLQYNTSPTTLASFTGERGDHPGVFWRRIQQLWEFYNRLKRSLPSSDSED